jgi:hypothetical protein
LKKQSFQSKLFLLLAKLNPSSKGSLIKLPNPYVSEEEEEEQAGVSTIGGAKSNHSTETVKPKRSLWNLMPSITGLNGSSSSEIETKELVANRVSLKKKEPEIYLPCDVCGNTTGYKKRNLMDIITIDKELKVEEIVEVEDDRNSHRRAMVTNVWDHRPKTLQEALVLSESFE